MAIRIVNGGNSVLEVAPTFDECRIESLNNEKSFITKIKDGRVFRKEKWTDDEVSEAIADLYENDAIGSVETDAENHDIVIHLRQLGEDGIEVGDIPEESAS